MIHCLRRRIKAYYDQQTIAGKLNSLLLLLMACLLANGLIVCFLLYIVAARSETLSSLDQIEKRVEEMTRALLRFRADHQRADALMAKESLEGAKVAIGKLSPEILAGQARHGEEAGILALMEMFETRFKEYLLYHEQSAALESGMRKAATDLLATMQTLQARSGPPRQNPILASLVQSVLGVRNVQLEFLLARDMGLAKEMGDEIKAIVGAAAKLRAGSDQVETQIEAYNIGQQALLLGNSFDKLRDYTRKKITNEESMAAAATAIFERVGRESLRQRESISRQIYLIVASMVFASALVMLLGSLLARRFVQSITTPLARLVEVAGEVARGDYEQPLAIGSQDEIGELATRFGDMAHTVTRQIASLRASEQQVLVRTAELEDANESLAQAKEAAEALNQSLEAKVMQRTAELEAANRKLTELTITDALTGLANRRRFDAVLADEWARAGRTGQSLGIIMLDVDGFKRYNDHYGHPAGDLCLQSISGVLKGYARRAGDLVARYGGEEFVVVAADSDADTVGELAETMRRSVEALAMPHQQSPCSEFVTVSIGFAVAVPDGGFSAETLLHMADAALYRAKEGGRNRVEAAT